MKQRVANLLSVDHERIRLWRYQNPSSWNHKPDAVAKNLVKDLEEQDYDSPDGKLPVFPGCNLDLIEDKRIGDMNQKGTGSNARRLCIDRECVFIEVLETVDSKFTFKFSTNKDDFVKCKFCERRGLYEKVYCICR